MRYRRMPIEIESPEEVGYDTIDCNLSESSVADRSLDDLGLDLELGSLPLCYGDHLGNPALRELIADDAGRVAGAPLHPDNVTITPGAAGALFAINSSVLHGGAHAVIMRTNYATNLETPRAIEADIDYFDLSWDDGFAVDLDRLATLIRPDTALVSLTCPHNPTGTMMSPDDLHAVVELVEQSNARLLFDETYRELTRGPVLPLAASLSSRAISVCSLSKAFGLPGLRLGWAITTDPTMAETLLAAKEQIFICGNTLDEEIAARVLAERDRILPPILAQSQAHFDLVQAWMDGQDTFEWIVPEGGVVCFPRIRPELAVNVDRFYEVLNGDLATYVGAGHWFEAERRHFRLGFGWPTTDELSRGLANLTAAAAAALEH